MINKETVFKAQYPVENGIIKTIKDSDVVGKNKRYRDLYDGFAKYYTPIQKLIFFIFRILGRENENPINKYFADLDIKPGDMVLEVSVGTGDNLETLPKDIDFYGLDISLGMLKQCLKRHGKNRKLTLIHGMAEQLPFKDESFDVVFHVGGINFFNDKSAAIKEMIRVAKPGTKFLIADETEKVAKSMENKPIARRFFKNRDEEIVPPVDLIPKDMLDVKLSYMCKNDEMYAITFTKPK